MHTRHSKMQIPPCCCPTYSATPSTFQHPNLPTLPPCRASKLLLCLALLSLYTLSLPPSLAQHPISSEGQEAAGSAQQARWPWGGCGRTWLENTGFEHCTKGTQHQGSATITVSSPELSGCHPNCVELPPHTSQESRMGCRRCSLFPSTPCCNSSSSSAQHGWKAIFLTNDFVGQRSLRLLLFGYPTVTGWFVVLWTITRINMDRFRAWVLWK